MGPMQTDLKSLREFAQRYTAAWCSQTPGSVAGFFSPNGSLTINDGAPSIGRDTIAVVAQSFMTAFPDLQVIMDDLMVENDSVEYRWILLGTNTGPGGTGNSVHIAGFERWQFGADGLIAASLGHFDAADYRRQLDRPAATSDAAPSAP